MENCKMNPKKIQIHYFSAPAWGHINPTKGWVAKLTKKYEVIYYTSKKYKKTIEETGAKVICYPKEEKLYFIDTPREQLGGNPLNLINRLLAYSKLVQKYFDHLPKNALVGYDSLAYFAKYLCKKNNITCFESHAILPLNFNRILVKAIRNELFFFIKHPKIFLT
jgi:UDP:flavonoid glycosyltransferase YjiC (YdhE family)